MPEANRRKMAAEAVAHAYSDHAAHPGYIAGQEMLGIVRARCDVPEYLRCYSCALLAENAVWCSKCDTLSCSLCLAPADEPWVCARSEEHTSELQSR